MSLWECSGQSTVICNRLQGWALIKAASQNMPWRWLTEW